MRIRWLLYVALLLGAHSRPVAAAESCLTCHADVKSEYLASVHASHFGCTACHGGDATVTALRAHDRDQGYRGTPTRGDIPALCASCHADAERMRPFAPLPTDQYAQYQKSEHGIALARGDTRVAVCTDCHGGHRILSPQEPTSPVARANVPATCGRCHADQQLMASYQLPADALEKFRGSVHGAALLVDEHPSAPTCATCHAAHGARIDEPVAGACGRCHSRTREYVEQGPHGRAVAAGQMKECTSCHAFHDTARPDRALFDRTCPACHQPGSTALDTAEKLKTLLTQAGLQLDAATRDVDQLEQFWPTVARKRSRLDQARAYFLEALPVQHALALARVDDLTRSSRSISNDVQAVVHGAQQESGLRYLWLAGLWAYVLFVAIVAFLWRRAQQDRPRGARQP